MKFKIGDKVKLPIDKITLGDWTWENCDVKKGLPAGQMFLEVHQIEGKNIILISGKKDTSYCSVYNEDDLELYIPEKWAIEKTKDNYKVVNDWFNKVTGRDYESKDGYMHFPDNTDSYFSYSKWEDYTEIDFDTFLKITNMEEEIVLKEGMKFISTINNVIYSIYKINSNGLVHLMWDGATYGSDYREEVLKQTIKQGIYKLIEERKVLGYIAPMDLFDGAIKKGQPVFKTLNNSDLYGDYADSPSRTLPKEIVETWQPYYAPAEVVLLIGDKNTEVKIGKGYIKAEGRDFKIDYLKQLYSSLLFGKVAGYNIEVPLIKIGCTTLPLSQLKKVIDTYNELNK